MGEWVFGGISIDGVDMNWLRESGRWQLTLLVVTYLVVVQVTNRVFVTSPAAERVQRDLDEERSEVALAELAADDAGADRREELNSLLDGGYSALSRGETARGATTKVKFTANLSNVMTARRYLHSAQRLRLRYDSKRHVAFGRMASARLHAQARTWTDPVRRSDATDLARQINGVLTRLDEFGAQPRPAGAEEPAKVKSARTELAILSTEALKLWYENDDESLERNAEAQRRTLWLVYAGLGAVLVVGLYGPRVPLLFGAVGGFLAPVIRIRRNRLDPSDYRTSWEVLMLGPVAGALSAYAGLLLIHFLASPDVGLLGEFLGEHAWANPHTATAKALALLLGYSATLFAFLAGKAATAVETSTADSPSVPVADPAPAPGGTPTKPSDEPPTVGEGGGGPDPGVIPGATEAERLTAELALLSEGDNAPGPDDGVQPPDPVPEGSGSDTAALPPEVTLP